MGTIGGDMHPAGGETTTESGVSAADCREICREAVRIWKEQVGRGPNFSRAFAVEGAIGMVFRDVLTPVERELIASGGVDAVREMRREVFESNRERLVEVVERISGRRVGAVLYDISPPHDTSGFLFLTAESEDAPA